MVSSKWSVWVALIVGVLGSVSVIRAAETVSGLNSGASKSGTVVSAAALGTTSSGIVITPQRSEKQDLRSNRNDLYRYHPNAVPARGKMRNQVSQPGAGTSSVGREAGFVPSATGIGFGNPESTSDKTGRNSAVTAGKSKSYGFFGPGAGDAGQQPVGGNGIRSTGRK